MNSILALSDEITCSLQSDYTLSEGCEKWRKFFGLTHAELDGTPLSEFMFASDWIDLKEKLIFSREKGRVGKSRYRFICSSNLPMWLEIKFVFDRELDQFLLVARDVTDYIEREHHLEERLQRYEYVLEGAGLGGWDWWLETDVVRFDRRWLEMLGLDPATTKHHLSTWDQLVHPEDREQAYADMYSCLKGEVEVYENVHRLRHADGHWVWILDRGRVSEYNQDGKAIRFTGTHLEINKYKDAEAMSSNIQKMGLIGGWEFVIANEEVRWTAQTYAIHDLDPDVPISREYGLSFYVGEERKRIAAYIDRCTSGSSFCDDFYFRSHKGVFKWVRAMGEPIYDATGKVIKLRGTFQDITDIKEKAAALNTLISSIDDIIFEIDKNAVCLNLWSQSDEKLFYPRSEIIGSNFFQMLPEPILTPFKASLAEVLQEKKTVSMHEYCDPFAPDPSQANWFRCKIAPQIIGDGQVERLTMVISDITSEVHSRQNELLKQKELEQIMGVLNKSAIVAITDRKGIILDVNENFIKTSQYSRDELIGSDHRIVKSDLHSPKFDDEIWQTVLQGNVWTGEISSLAKDGTQYIMQTVISPLMNTSGEIDRYFSIHFDVSKLKEYEGLLEEAQRVAKIGSWSYEAWSKRYKWSSQMYEIFGLDEDQGGPSFEEQLELIHPDDRDEWATTFSRCLENSTPFRMRFRVRDPASEGHIWVEAHGDSRRSLNNKTILVSGTCQNVTELVHAEEQARQERAMTLQASKLVSLGEMSAGIAHEINNPLTIISGMSHLIARFINEPDKVRTKLESINQAIERIAKIINGLRKFSRSSDRSDYENYQLSEIINEALILTSARSKSYATDQIFKNGSNSSIHCNVIEIEQVLINLINNGVDAVRELDERWVKIHTFDEGTEVVVQVIDSGHGISDVEREKLFQPFHTTKPIGEGTGLGLSIAKGIIDDHGATIRLLDNVPHTCFEIRFPRA